MYWPRLARPHHHPYPGSSSMKCGCWSNDGITLLHSFAIRNEHVFDNLELNKWHIQVLPGMNSGRPSSCSVASLILRLGSAQPEWRSCALNAGLQPGEQLPGQDTAPSLLPPYIRRSRADAGVLRGEAGLMHRVRREAGHCPRPPGSQCACALCLLPSGRIWGPSHTAECLLV